MRRHFYFAISLFFWLLMVIGFSDNWLFDVGQESNSDPRFLIHAFFAFCWFTLLVVQTSLIHQENVRLHMKLGIAGMIVYPGFFVTTSYIYVTRFIAEGYLAPLASLNVALFVYATFLITRGFLVRKRHPNAHKTNIIVGTFMLMEPSISRSLSHLFGSGTELYWLLTYILLFSLFIWHFRKINWQILVGFMIWLLGTVNFILSMG